jgi:hypothetical protein
VTCKNSHLQYMSWKGVQRRGALSVNGNRTVVLPRLSHSHIMLEMPRDANVIAVTDASPQGDTFG